MAVRKPQPRKPEKSAVDLAIGAILDGNPNPLDEDMSAVNPDRTSLDLPGEEHEEMCSRCARPAVNRCPECRCVLCEDSLGLVGTEDSV